MKSSLEVIRVRLIIALAHLEDASVDKCGHNAARQRTHPVDPVICPYTLYNGGSKGACRVHAGAGELDLSSRRKKRNLSEICTDYLQSA